jgi:soluble lytic murein transglycosylase
MTRLGALARGALLAGLAGACGGAAHVLPPSLASASPIPLAKTREVIPKDVAAEVPPLFVVLDAPPFAGVKARLQARDAPGAVKAFADARAAAPAETDPARVCALDYVAGSLARDAADDTAAAAAFDRVPESCPLWAHASYYGAGAYERLGRPDEAIARAARVPDDASIAVDARLLRAEAASAKGDKAAAVAVWREHLRASPHGVRWVDTCVRLATAILDGAEGDPAKGAREAFDLATRIVVEAPKYADSSGAQAARDRAALLLHAKDPSFSGALTVGDRARRAQAWLDANEPAKALAEAEPLLALGAPGTVLTGEVPTGADICKAATARAQATAKLRGATADAYGDAIARCAGDDTLPAVLYGGAKASFAAKRSDEGLARVDALERLNPQHRLTDDAHLRAAIYLQQNGDAPKGEALLATLADEHPDGDMRGEALFRVALGRMTRGDWAGAKEPLDRAAVLEAGDHRSPNAERAAYFRARAAAMTGDLADARARYVALIGRTPLAFYMSQAYARLAAMDPGVARAALDRAVQAESAVAPIALLTRDHAELHAASFTRGRALLEVGDIDDARRELARVLPTEGADAEVAWAVALLYEEAGAPDAAEGVIGAHLADYLTHYPAGRWKTCWEIAFPRPFADWVEKASATSGIPTALTWAIMRQESAFVADARSPSDAYGLMQIIVRTARGLTRGTGYGADPDSLKRPEVSITLGAKLLGTLRASYPANRALAIAAYNGGGGSVGRWLAARPNEDFDLWVEEIPFDETRNYMKRVLGNEAAYAYLYAPAALDEVLALPPKVAR